MLDISLAELLLIVVVAIIFIGPRELPQLLRFLAKTMRAVKKITTDIRKIFDDIAEESGIKDDVQMIRGDDGKLYEAYQLPVHKTQKSDDGGL